MNIDAGGQYRSRVHCKHSNVDYSSAYRSFARFGIIRQRWAKQHRPGSYLSSPPRSPRHGGKKTNKITRIRFTNTVAPAGPYEERPLTYTRGNSTDATLHDSSLTSVRQTSLSSRTAAHRHSHVWNSQTWILTTEN